MKRPIENSKAQLTNLALITLLLTLISAGSRMLRSSHSDVRPLPDPQVKLEQPTLLIRYYKGPLAGTLIVCARPRSEIRVSYRNKFSRFWGLQPGEVVIGTTKHFWSDDVQGLQECLSDLNGGPTTLIVRDPQNQIREIYRSAVQLTDYSRRNALCIDEPSCTITKN